MRAIIYTRVSSDQSGQQRSVVSQEAECRAVCERNAWDVAEVLIDNDRGASRWSTKDRPEYKKLAKTLKAGDVLVTWEASRAQRDLAAYVTLRDLCAERGVFWSYQGKLHDLSKGDDRFGTGLDALLAEREADQIRDRVLRGKRAAAQTGRPAGRPPYGYKRAINPVTGKTDNWVIDPVTGPVVKDVIQRTLAGESLWSIVRDLKTRGVPPPQVQRNAAQDWRPQRLRVTISSPTYAGLRKHQGVVIGKGTWEPIIAPEEHERLLGIFADPIRRSTHRGPEPRHLLTGIARCGVCGEGMRYTAAPSSRARAPRYLCSGRICVGRRTDGVDLLVVETILSRLERTDVAALLAKRDGEESAESLAVADNLRRRLNGFIDQAAAGDLTPQALARIEAKLLPQIESAEAKARASYTSPLVAGLAGPDARAKWELFSIKDRRTVVASLLDVTIQKVKHGSTRRFDPLDIDIAWKSSSEA